MAAPKVVSSEKVTPDEFNELLSQYPAVAEAISQSKGAKNGQKSLSELDQYRYVDALETFGGEKPRRAMDLDDVKALVQWKLRHGKFRPSLMNLVSSNTTSFTSQTIQSALQTYHSKSDAAAALSTLANLKGIGPATASLLLTVHDPQNVIFFSDEVFYWLCCQGKKSPIKYNPKEYQALHTEAQRLAKRLNVSATDIEKVAYVLMKQQSEPLKGTKDSSTAAAKESRKLSSPGPSGKRKAPSRNTDVVKKDNVAEKAAEENEDETQAPVRRSKRLRK